MPLWFAIFILIASLVLTFGFFKRYRSRNKKIFLAGAILFALVSLAAVLFLFAAVLLVYGIK